MSAKTLAWALERKMDRASLKLLLIAVADLANHDTSEVYPSLALLQEITGMSKKTVLSGLDELCEKGILERTDERKGRTGQIPVYLFHMVSSAPAIRRSSEIQRGDKRRPLGKGGGTPSQTGDIATAKQGQNDATEPSIRNLEGNNPPLPTGEATPTGDQDLFGVEIHEIEQPLHEFVAEQWRALKADHPRVQAIDAMTHDRRVKIQARAHAIAQTTGETERQVWTRMFAAIRASAFLRGDAEPGRGYSKSMALNINFVLRPSQFLPILERAPIDERDDRETRTASGRQMGPAEQAGRAALARMGSAPEQRGEIGSGGIYLPKRSRRA